MEKSQVVIFGGDYSFNAPAFTLMGQTMESVDRYKYLGLWFHESLGRPNGPRAPSRPPKSVASEYLQQRFIMAIYARAFYQDPDTTLDDLREAVTTAEDTARIARRVFGGAHPLTVDTQRELRNARAALRAHETPPPGSA